VYGELTGNRVLNNLLYAAGVKSGSRSGLIEVKQSMMLAAHGAISRSQR